MSTDHKFGHEGERLGWVSIIVNIFLFVLKYIAGILGGSVALIADAWHTLGDSLSSIIMIVGIRISRKPPDEEHPYGHGRAEWLASLFIGVFLIVIAASFVKESLERLRDHEDFSYGVIAWIATILSIIIKEVLAQLSFRVARKTGLRSLRADGWHHRTDSISSVIVLLGLIIGNRFWWIDGVLGIIVSFLILYAAIQIIRENSSAILGEKPDQKTIDSIYSIVEKNCQREVNLHNLKIHQYGQHKEMTAHIKLRGSITLDQSHAVATAIEKMIWDELKIETTLHVEPKDNDDDIETTLHVEPKDSDDDIA